MFYSLLSFSEFCSVLRAFWFLWRHSLVSKKYKVNLGNPQHLGLPWWLGASLVAQTIKNLQCKRSRFDPWIRKIPWRLPWLGSSDALPLATRMETRLPWRPTRGSLTSPSYLRSQGNRRWEGPLGTPLGVVHWKRASSPVEAGTAGYL